jgi:glyoxylase-like metal-dependent hydrolase (beta-lactamase superfamily II)
VTAIINTHWHLDHIGGNPFLRREFPGVRVYASGALADARKGFLANYRAQLEEMIAKSTTPEEQKPWRAELAIIDAGDALAPDELVTTSGKRSIAGRNLVLGLESHAVTAGDVWVFDPATRVLVSGDLVTLPVPFLDTACPAQWKLSLEHLSKTDFDILVPGHGAPMHRKEFEAYRTAYGNLLACTGSAKEKKDCIDGWMSDVAGLITSEDPRFVQSLLDYYIDNSLRGDPAHTAKLCGK